MHFPDNNRNDAMETEQQQQKKQQLSYSYSSYVTQGREEQDDPFLIFIHNVRSTLCGLPPALDDDPLQPPGSGMGWGWIANRLLKTCATYPSGVTPAILLSEISMAWSEQNRSGAPKKQLDCIVKLKKKRNRLKLPNTITIDSIYEKKFLSLSSVIEAVIINAYILPGTDIYMLTLGDVWSSNTIDLYLHRRFYDIADLKSGILKQGREILLTGCYLRIAAGSLLSARILPTEYLVVLLDEDEDDDAMLLGAQFCFDSFSSISLDAVKEGASYSLYARIDYIGPLEVQGKHGSVKRKQVTLVDMGGMRLNFLLWGEQVQVANLFSVGSMLAIDKPFIASAIDSSLETSGEICLEYGSATQLFMVPVTLHEEQVCVAMTQSPYQGSKLLNASYPSQGPTVSQVTLPCDSQGTIDFSNYPFRSYIADLRNKMTGISLYCVVTDIRASEGIFSLKIEDTTGAVWAKLHFSRYWSLGRLAVGHIIYISGLSSSLTPRKSLELSWFQSGTGSSFFNLSCLPAFLNSSCFQRLLSLSGLSTDASCVQVCRIWVDRVECCYVDTRLMHTHCGHLADKAASGDMECKFCHKICTGEVEPTFRLKIALADETAATNVIAWCVGQTATELLQISPDEFYELPEEEQIMYPASLENETFIVAIASSRRRQRQQQEGGAAVELEQGDHHRYNEAVGADWEVTYAIKCE
ncbi:uncharacterized protein LOC127247647 [Andrographis paniculata]|uniref:uncharacterized protein LOC127247647 n=1 Tax=Andrographis paniculata TaxID=175694 RepID=UPI0021E91426|nr:uncharacterized protein LOC127247647 [Andrographis paniculata]